MLVRTAAPHSCTSVAFERPNENTITSQPSAKPGSRSRLFPSALCCTHSPSALCVLTLPQVLVLCFVSYQRNCSCRLHGCARTYTAFQTRVRWALLVLVLLQWGVDTGFMLGWASGEWEARSCSPLSSLLTPCPTKIPRPSATVFQRLALGNRRLDPPTPPTPWHCCLLQIHVAGRADLSTAH